MGIQDREYYRENSSRYDSWTRQGATIWLIVITCIVFFFQCFTTPPARSEIAQLGWYSYPKIVSGEVWRLVTPIFLHVGIWHLFVNMLILWWTGSRLEELYGPKEFAAFYLLGGTFANCVNLAADASGFVPGPPLPGLGASGAVTATLVLFAFHFPWQRVYLMFVLPMPVWAVVIIYIVLDSLGALGFGRGNIGYIVHLGGALFGALYFQLGIRFTELFSFSARPRARRVRPQLRVVEPPILDDTPEPVGAAVESPSRPREVVEETLEDKVDALLAKVSKQGQESLTAEEREILFKASELYKKRRK